MANVKISELPAASTANGTDELEANQSGVSRKLTVAQVKSGLATSGAITSSGLTMTSARVLGRSTASTGAVEELSSVPVTLGGTGATDASTARTNLGLGSIATQAASGVAITGGSITGITDLAVADGGTGASDAATARTNLGLGSAATMTGPSGTIVGTTDTQTLTNKTISAGVFNDGYTEETVTANTSTAYTIDLANGTVQILTLTGNCTFTFPTATAGKSFMLLLKQDATGSRTATWPAAVKWPSSTAPTITATASKGDKFVFTADGTYWWGSNAGQAYL